MAVKYKLVLRPNFKPGTPAGEKLYYASSSVPYPCRVETLYEIISDRSCATRGEVEAVIEGFIKIVIMRLKEGLRVQVGRIGYLSTALGSSGVKNAEDFKPALIKSRRVIFRPSARLLEVARKLKVERIEQPELNPSAPPEKGGGDDIL